MSTKSEWPFAQLLLTITITSYVDEFIFMFIVNVFDKRFAGAASKRRGVFESRSPESQN